MQFTNSLVSIVCNSTLSKYGGEVMISVYTIINSVRQVLETPVIAIGEGTSPVISYNYGARRPGHVRKAMLLMGCLGIGYTLIVWILIERFPTFFISMFSTDAALMKDAIPALHLYFFAFVFQSLQYTGQTTFKALGKKKQAIFFSLFRKVVMVVPLTLLLPGVFHFGSDGVFMADPISNVIGGTACMVTMPMRQYHNDRQICQLRCQSKHISKTSAGVNKSRPLFTYDQITENVRSVRNPDNVVGHSLCLNRQRSSGISPDGSSTTKIPSAGNSSLEPYP